jgi:hypothetical protein
MPDEILNPNIYLNYIEPTEAGKYEVARNVYLVTLGALLWDMLSSLNEDWQLIRTSKPSPVLFAYFSTRLCALVTALLSVLVKTGPITNCGVLAFNVRVFWVVATASSSYLILKRVHAVFFQDRIVCHIFTFLWLATFGVSLVVLPGPLKDYYELANTKHCAVREMESYVSAAYVVPMIFDGIVFLAITYKIHVFHGTSKPRSWKTFVCNDALPRLSRAVLQGGQRYYLITTAFSVTRPFFDSLPTAAPVLSMTASRIPSMALTSVMACRVFRNLRHESLPEIETGVLTAMRFAQLAPVNVHLPKSGDEETASDDLEQVSS